MNLKFIKTDKCPICGCSIVKGEWIETTYTGFKDEVIGLGTALTRKLGLKDKLPDMSEEEQFEILSTDGMLVKRPVLVGDDFVLVGFKIKEWEEKLL